jgi:LDH2 family malate/lactate/ureidoglycolate dehydrogenase
MVKDAGTATNTGHAIVAVSIDTFCPPAEFKRAVDAVVRDIRGSARLPGVDRLWVPGEQAAEKLKNRTAHGIPMPKPLKDSLDALARDLGIAGL